MRKWPNTSYTYVHHFFSYITPEPTYSTLRWHGSRRLAIPFNATSHWTSKKPSYITAQLNTGAADVLKTKDSPYPQSGRSRGKLGTSLHRGESRPRHKFRAAAAPPEETWACAADERRNITQPNNAYVCTIQQVSQSVRVQVKGTHLMRLR